MPQSDEFYMRHALELALQGTGLTSPNPLVGAIVVADGRIVGEGFHVYSSKKHAEVWALEQAGELARGSVVYVTLEPCSHHGRTPPCTDQLIAAGVRRVVAAAGDPNPLVAGSGFQRLRSAGIELTWGVCEAEARRQNEAYRKFVRSRLPFVILKTAMTLDGKIAEANGSSQWISGDLARQRVQELRFSSDAILTGIGTVLADDPLLTDRTQKARNRSLLRVVMDTWLRLPRESRLVQSRNQGEIVVFCSEGRNLERQQLLEAAGIEILPVSLRGGRIPLDTVLAELGRRDIVQLLLEGGSEINFEAIRCGVVDKLLCFIAPKILGGTTPRPIFGGEGFTHLQNAAGLRFSCQEMIGDDLLIEAYLSSPEETMQSL